MENKGVDDDLEITSIGALHRGGLWDKKYWSSSRGKDRYPYPVGYQAIRTHAGNKYKMEIREGLKGPVFAVTAPDGDSCIGQTPDIAWENFQKKSCPRVKNWLGKRFSSKMDGVELFGFRNPFVQRLLRELVANVNGVAEKSLVASSLGSKDSKLNHEESEESHAYPDLLPCLGKRPISGKRSMKNRYYSENIIKEARIKRTRSQVLVKNADCDSSKESTQKDKNIVHFLEKHISSSKSKATVPVTSSPISPEDDIAVVNNELLDPEYGNDMRTVGCASSIKISDRIVEPGLALQVKMTDVEEKCHSLPAVGEVQMESKCHKSFVETNVLSHEQNSQIIHENQVLTYVRKKLLKKSFDAELGQRGSSTSPKYSDGEDVDLVRYPDIPDTCDTEKDNVVGSPMKGQNDDLCSMEELSVARSISCLSNFPVKSLPEEVASKSNDDITTSIQPLPDGIHITCTPVDTLPIGVIKDSLPEVGSSSGSSNQSLEKIDLDLAGQELARSMMTFLLPRAIPLLPNTYVKRRSRHRSRENKNDCCSPLFIPNSAEEVGNKHPGDIMCQGNNVAKDIVQGSELHIQEKMNAGQALQGNDSLYHQATRVEPFTIIGSSKDIKFVIPDSFEDDKYAHDMADRQFPSSFDEVKITFLDRKKGSLSPLMLPENTSERPLCSGNDGCNDEVVLRDGNEMDNTDEVPKADIARAHAISSTEKVYSSNPNGQVNFDFLAATDQAAPDIALIEHENLAGSISKGESSLLLEPNVLPFDDQRSHSHKMERIPQSSQSSDKNIVPLSEIIICRNYKNCDSPELHFQQIIPGTDENDPAGYISSNTDLRKSAAHEVKGDEELQQLITDASSKQDVVKNATEDIKPCCTDPSVSSFKSCVNSAGDLCLPGENCIQSEDWIDAMGDFLFSDMDPPMLKSTNRDCAGHSQVQNTQKGYLQDSFTKTESSTLEMRDSMELIGCYMHPNPVLSISLTSKVDGLHICVLCGLVDSDVRNLFMYMVPDQGYRENCPSFLGYTSLKGPCNQNLPLEGSQLQFIPGHQRIVFLHSIKAPRCREHNFDCSCTNCTSDCSEENNVEIVHVNFGYVSSVIKLATVERASSILVCEPNYLIAIEESGNLHVWVMNLEWSANMEEFVLPKFDELPPAILELKAIPNCDSFIIGHNGLGDFALWYAALPCILINFSSPLILYLNDVPGPTRIEDVSKRVLLAKFSSAGITTFQILPIGLFKWQSEDPPATCAEMDHTKETKFMAANWLPKAGEDPPLPLSEEDIAVWLLISADTSTDARQQVKEPNIIHVGCWRLGLLVRNTVVLGNILHPRASAANASSHYGIYGTCDGFLYKWELSSGENLARLHPFKCGSVSHIAIDTKSGALALANNGCQLKVYMQPQFQT